MIVDESREPDFYILMGDKHPRGYYKNKTNIPSQESATECYQIQEGYFDDVTIVKNIK